MNTTAYLINKKFCSAPPLLLASEPNTIKLEIKPYLQPFERILAIRELKAILRDDETIREEYGYWLVDGAQDEAIFRERLTYWQRVGRESLYPTLQTTLEYTQSGVNESKGVKGQLHRSRRLRYGPHDIHEYRGKFFPQLVRSLINISGVPRGGLVLDPMCGSGTTPCEAIAFGFSAIGADLNPLSILISKIKASIPLKRGTDFKAQTLSYIDNFQYNAVEPATVWAAEDLTYLYQWFTEAAINDLAKVLAELNKMPDGIECGLLRVCLSDVVRGISWQKDADLRVRKEIIDYIPGTAIEQFRTKVKEQIERIDAYLSVLPSFSKEQLLEIHEGNSINIDTIFAEFQGNVDVLITSPPYATALPYLDTDRLSLIVLNLLTRKEHRKREINMIGTREITERQRKFEWDRFHQRRHELPQRVTNLIDEIAITYHAEGVGFRRRNLPALLGKYFLDMLDAMKAARTLMKSGAYGYYMVGNNSTQVNGNRVDIPTDEFLFDIGASAGWKQIETINMDLLPSRDIFKSNRGSKETILMFQA